MAYNPIAAGEVDQDSPLTEGLTQKIRDNQDYHQGRFHNSTGHNHDGDTDDGAPITSFPSNVTADGDVTVAGTITAGLVLDLYAVFQGEW